MSLEKAKSYLEHRGFADRVMEFDVSSATVELAAEAIGCEARAIAKTLSFLVDEKAILIVAAGDSKIDNGKFKATFHTKAKMLSSDTVEALVGHAVGGVCPFGVNDSVAVYLDASLKALPTVYPACGSSNSAVRLTVDELSALLPDAAWIDVCKAPTT